MHNKNITAGEQFTLHLGDNLATLKSYPDNTFDSIVTDPPYGIDFLGKEWDSHTGTVELYKECLRVLKPGGYLLAFSAARTYHKLAYSVELAGFEIRDQLMWLYASGFPKAQDIGKAIQKRLGVEETGKVYDNSNGKGLASLQTWVDNGEAGINLSIKEQSATTICTSPLAKEWEGFKTALKPAHEPIVMARKPFKGSTIDNVLKNGLGAMNIDATRVPWADAADAEQIQNAFTNEKGIAAGLICVNGGPMFQGSEKKKKSDHKPFTKETFDGQTGFKDRIPAEELASPAGRYPSNVIGEVEEGYQKYFYCPKVSRKERHSGFEAPPPEALNNPDDMKNHPLWDPSIGTNSHRLMQKIRKAQGITSGTKTHWQMAEEMGGSLVDHEGHPTRSGNKANIPGYGDLYTHRLSNVYEQWCKDNNKKNPSIGNNHPTVKPVALMDYLIRLVTPPSTPELQRKVLDPFMGSGSTGMAAVKLGHHFTGCELDPKYVAIAETRIRAWNEPEVEDEPQLPDSLFDLNK